MAERLETVGHNGNKYSLTQLMLFLNLMGMKSRKKAFVHYFIISMFSET